MGLVIAKVWNKLFKRETQYKVLMLGLDNAGKTTILYRMFMTILYLLNRHIG